jgi:adenylosuccinate synthase
LKITDDTLRVVILSGPICAGKSTVVESLCKRYGARPVKTRDLIKHQLPGVKDERGALQRAGEKLDRADGGAWVKNALVRGNRILLEGTQGTSLSIHHGE